MKLNVHGMAYYASNFCGFRSTLSTTNNSESDPDFTTYAAGYGYASVLNTKNKILTLTSKTTYYMNASNNTATVDGIWFRNDFSKMIIRAVCAYL